MSGEAGREDRWRRPERPRPKVSVGAYIESQVTFELRGRPLSLGGS